MKVPFVYGPDDLRLCEVEPPKAGPRDVVIGVGAAGICGSDLGFVAEGGLMAPTDKPFPIGHELADTIVAVGDEVTSFAVGDRVVLNPLINYIGNGAPEGGFAERLLVRDIVSNPGALLRLPDELSLEVGALIEPLLSVATHAVNQLGASVGDKVAIYGAGPIGLASVVVLRHRGIEDVVVFDLSPLRRERAVALGAKAAFDPRETSPAVTLMELHGSVQVFYADVPQTSHFLEASGAPVIPSIMEYARSGATICVVSVQKKPVEVDFKMVMAKEIRFTGALGYPTEFSDVLATLKGGATNLDAMVSHRFDGDDFMEAFATAQQADKAAKVLVKYNV